METSFTLINELLDKFIINDKKIKYTIKKEYKNDKKGHIYILKHPKLTNMYKVGRSIDAVNRAKKWGYTLLFFCQTNNYIKIERLIHLHLKNYNVIIDSINGSGKKEIEWFNINYDILTSCIVLIINYYDNKINKNLKN